MLKVAPSKETVLVELSFDFKVTFCVYDENNKLRFSHTTKDYYVEVEVPANYADDEKLLNDWVQWSFEDYDCCTLENLNIREEGKQKFRFD